MEMIGVAGNGRKVEKMRHTYYQTVAREVLVHGCTGMDTP